MLWTTYPGDVRIGMQAACISGQRPAQTLTECVIDRDESGPKRLRTELEMDAASR